MAKFNNNSQNFTLNYEYMDIKKLLDEVKLIFRDHIEVKNLKMLTEVESSIPALIYSDPKRLK